MELHQQLSENDILYKLDEYNDVEIEDSFPEATDLSPFINLCDDVAPLQTSKLNDTCRPPPKPPHEKYIHGATHPSEPSTIPLSISSFVSAIFDFNKKNYST